MKTKNPISNHPMQMEVWNSKARFIMLCAGRRSGKTFLAIEKILHQSEKPKANIIYMAPTRQQAKDIAWQALKRRVIELNWSVIINESELKITRANKTQIMLRSAEKPDRLRGLGINYIVLDEFAEYKNPEVWTQVIRPALSDKRGKALFIFTPKGLNMAYDLFQSAKTEPNWAAYSFKTIDAPFFQTPEGLDELDDARRNLTEKDFKQEYEASFETHAGRIYYAFDRQLHNTDYVFNPVNGPIYIGADFNRSPMAWTYWQIVNGVMYQFGELFLKFSSTKECCEVTRQKFGDHHIIARPDATGNRKTSNSSLSDFDIMKQHGFFIESSGLNPRRIDRWTAVNKAFESNLVKINVANCPESCKDREKLLYLEGRCEPDLSDPYAGHISDAGDYSIYRQFPIVLKSSARTGHWA